jgi:hypothetical protein
MLNSALNGATPPGFIITPPPPASAQASRAATANQPLWDVSKCPIHPPASTDAPHSISVTTSGGHPPGFERRDSRRSLARSSGGYYLWRPLHLLVLGRMGRMIARRTEGCAMQAIAGALEGG